MENFKISIPTPCHERWEDFTPTPTGGFCQSCSKNVRDFTKMDDSEVVAFFRDNKGKNLCGSFRDDQLKRDFTVNQWFPEWAIEANIARIELPISQIQSKSKILRLPASLRFAASFALLTFAYESNGQTIKGKVLAADSKKPLSNVSVAVKGSDKNLDINTKGEFEISAGKEDRLVFSFSKIETKGVGIEEKSKSKTDEKVIQPNLERTFEGRLGGISLKGIPIDNHEPTEGLLDDLIENIKEKRALKKQTIRGKVVDANDNTPIEGVSIKIKDTQKGVLTNEKGEFSIIANKTDKLILSSVGYKEQEVESKNSKEIKMQEDAIALGDVDVVGFVGSCRRGNYTGLTSIVKTNGWSQISYENDPLKNQKIETGIAVAANPTVGDETIVISKLLDDEMTDNQALIKEWVSKNAFQKINQILVYDLSGKQYPIRYEKLNDGEIRLNLSRVPDGLYILRMSYSNEKSLTNEVISMTRLEVVK